MDDEGPTVLPKIVILLPCRVSLLLLAQTPKQSSALPFASVLPGAALALGPAAAAEGEFQHAAARLPTALRLTASRWDAHAGWEAHHTYTCRKRVISANSSTRHFPASKL